MIVSCIFPTLNTLGRFYRKNAGYDWPIRKTICSAWYGVSCLTTPALEELVDEADQSSIRIKEEAEEGCPTRNTRTNH